MKISQMVKGACLGALLLGLPLVGQGDALSAELRARVSDCAQDAKAFETVVAQLPAAEQIAFLQAVNEAISKMPQSVEEKGARFYQINRAAVLKAASGNLAPVLAEVYAMVPPEFLTDINERFAKDLFKRSEKITDAQFVGLATNTMKVVNARCEKASFAGVRETFAILTFLRASNGTPADLKETLVATLPSKENQQLALKSWINPALGIGQEQTYDPMLGISQAGDEPDHAVVTSLTGSNDLVTSLLSDLEDAQDSKDMKKPFSKFGAGSFQSLPTAGLPMGTLEGEPDIGLTRVPRTAIQDPESDYYKRRRKDHSTDQSQPEPEPYVGQ